MQPAILADGVRPSRLLLAFTLIALVLGVYGRFKGLGFAPVSPDEYYLARSIDGILKYGLPAFDCGGFYQRGLGLQYLIAAVRLTTLSPELSSRIVCALASLATLPAVFLVGRRFLSINISLAVMAILALSVWEIEIARFGRMYAPFQAVFAWYLVYFFNYTIDRNERALRGMILLTVAGALCWEGGVFIALANFVPILIRYAETNHLERRDWSKAALFTILLICAYFLATANLRYLSSYPPYPLGYSSQLMETPVSKLDLFGLPTGVPRNAPWLLGFVAVILLCVWSLRWVWSWHKKPLVTTGLLCMLVAALTHQFLIVISIAAILLLLQQITIGELLAARARVFICALALALLLWVSYALVYVDWPSLATDAGSMRRAFAVFFYQFIRIPNVTGNIIHPFASAVPILGALILAGLLARAMHYMLIRGELRSTERLLMLLVILMILAIGISHPPREETRYSAFLFPSVVLLFASATNQFFRRLSLATNSVIPALAVLVLYHFTEDLSYRHIATVDSNKTTFRIGMTNGRQSHLEIRDDVREIAQWLQIHASSTTDIVVNGVHGFDYYFSGTQYFFVDERSSNFADWSCRNGTVDRWTNLPLIYTFDGLKSKTAQYKNTYLVTFNLTSEQLQQIADRHPAIVMKRGWVSLIAMTQPG